MSATKDVSVTWLTNIIFQTGLTVKRFRSKQYFGFGNSEAAGERDFFLLF